MITPDDATLCFLGWRPTGDLGPLTSYTTVRGKVVWFLKAPPTCPPTPHQVRQRNVFRFVARTWQAMSAAQREQWSLAERRGKLNITGYNLFVWWSTVGNDAIIRTIERQTSTILITQP